MKVTIHEDRLTDRSKVYGVSFFQTLPPTGADMVRLECPSLESAERLALALRSFVLSCDVIHGTSR